MDLHQLKLFRDLASELSFVRVARMNHLTQPAVSFQIKKLEERLRLKLFERVPHRVALTNEAKLLLPRVEEILESCANLETFSGEVINLPGGEIRIASIHSIGMYELGPILQRFLASYPRVHVRLQYAHASEIYDLVKRKKVDLGIVAYPHEAPLVKLLPFGSDRMVLALPRGHRLAGKGRIRVKQLEGEDFIAFDEGIPTREAIDKALRAARVTINVRMTNDNIYAIKSAVQAKLGVAIVPESTIREEIQYGILHSAEIRDIDLVRPRGILVHGRKEPSKTASMFIQSSVSKPKSAIVTGG